MELLLANILPIILIVIMVFREIFIPIEKKKSFDEGYKQAKSESKDRLIKSIERAKTIRENNEKLTDDELDDAIASGLYKERNPH